METFSREWMRVDVRVTQADRTTRRWARRLVLVAAGIAGVELADTLTQLHPTLKVLLMSGYSADAVAADDPRFQRWTLLSKPYSVRDLLHEVRRTIDAP